MMPDPPFVPAGVRPSPLCPGRRDVAAPASPEILLDEENVPQEPARDQDRRRSDQQPVVSLHRLLLPPVSACSWRCLGADGQRRGASTHSSTRYASPLTSRETTRSEGPVPPVTVVVRACTPSTFCVVVQAPGRQSLARKSTRLNSSH